MKKLCEHCGKEFETRNTNARFCSNQCQSTQRHIDSYKDFLENNEKYCKGNYTPKHFKKEFLDEQNGVCAICGCEQTHNGKPLTFVLDHIDGDASNNRRENLRMICPNCHALTDNYCGRKLKKPKTTKQRPSKIVPKEQLLNDFKEFGSFSGVGKKYGVSDKAVVKWCGKYNLPIRSIDMRKYVREFFGENIKWKFNNGNPESLKKYKQ